MHRTLLSLFDYSGAWSQPFWDNGWDVIQWDMKLHEFMDLNLMDSAEAALDTYEDIDGIIAAVPCTDFAVSGAQYWKSKDHSGRTKESAALVERVLQLVDLFRPTDPDYTGTFFWAIENPVGRLNTLFPELPKPVYFHPYEYAGWNTISEDELLALDVARQKLGVNLSADEVDLIWKVNAYTKKTGLWGEFNPTMIKKAIEPVKGSAQGSVLQRLGGSSAKTKEMRSNTPSGFALAFYEAQKDHTITI
jgi:hypothetical protein